MAYAASLNGNQDFIGIGFWPFDFFDRERTLDDLVGRHVEAECVAYASRDWLRGRQVRSPLFGRAAGIRPDGALLVDSGTAPAAVREGHVELA